MFGVAKETDVLRGVEGSSAWLNKIYLLAAYLQPQLLELPQAEARRNMYDELMAAVEEKGVELAYRQTARAYANLPLHNLSQLKTQTR